MSDIAAARAVMATKAVTFRTAARLLPADAADDAALVYAFCRVVDDLADDLADEKSLTRIRAELRGEAAPGPTATTFLEVARRRQIPIGAATDLIDGALSDLHTVRIPDDRALFRYGYAVAGTVGRMMAPLLGASGGHAAAVHLGVAMQLTNICRDVLEDAQRGRVYLPTDRLRAAGVDPEALVSGTADRARVAAVVLDVLALADRWYESAEAGMQHLPARTRLAVLLAARTYRAIGQKLARNGGDALAGRTVLSPWARAVAAVQALVAWPFPRRASHDVSLDTPLLDLPGMA
jgi:phytoene synthase